MYKKSERDGQPFSLVFCPPLWAAANFFYKHCYSVSNAELPTVSRISRAHWSHLELMLLGFNPLWSTSEPLIVVVWKPLEVRVQLCCISPVDGWGLCREKTWNELWDPIMSGNPWILTELSSFRLFRRTFFYGKSFAEFRGFSWALPRNGHTPCFSPSLAAQISSMRSHSSLHYVVWTPQVRALPAFFLILCHLSGLSFEDIGDGKQKQKVKTVLRFRNLVRPQICWHKPPFAVGGLRTEKKILRMLTRINNKLR